jgi:hypothetical protein
VEKEEETREKGKINKNKNRIFCKKKLSFLFFLFFFGHEMQRHW